MWPGLPGLYDFPSILDAFLPSLLRPCTLITIDNALLLSDRFYAVPFKANPSCRLLILSSLFFSQRPPEAQRFIETGIVFFSHLVSTPEASRFRLLPVPPFLLFPPSFFESLLDVKVDALSRRRSLEAWRPPLLFPLSIRAFLRSSSTFFRSPPLPFHF